jgi:peptide/nickel transport system permease protein
MSGVWRRFRRERLAVVALVGLLLIVAACFVVEPILEHSLGRAPDTPYLGGVETLTHKPVGPWSWVPQSSSLAPDHPLTGKTLFLLGADGPLGRDELLRVLAGGRVSLEVAMFATLIAMVLGVAFGTIAGWYGGATDAVVGRVTELIMAFPLLLLVIAFGQTVASRFDNYTLWHALPPGVLSLSVIIGFFSWFYPARICRALVQDLREREFVEAARMIGQSEHRILRKHILPHLVGPMSVWAALIGASVIVLEAALSALNFGVKLPTPSWGNLLGSNFGSILNFDPFTDATTSNYVTSNWTLVWPSLALFLTVLFLSLVSDGLRNAVDPRADG